VAETLGPRKPAIDGWNSIRRYQVNALAHLFEEHAHGQNAADRIAIWP
jgi:hypothetical protein